MANVHDVAAYILQRAGTMSAMKLQKLVYYSQAWHLVWDEEPLFAAPIEAWANGPVVRELYNNHRGLFTLSEWPRGDAKALTESERDTIAAVTDSYGRFSAQELSERTHQDLPWQDARRGLGPTERGNSPISVEVMQQYYSAVDADSTSEPV